MVGKRQDTETDKMRSEDTIENTDGLLEEVCGRFQSLLRNGQSPQLESFLAGWNEPERSKLLGELLVLELDHFAREGRGPTQAEYAARFPHHRDVINDAWESWSGTRTIMEDPASRDTLVMKSHLGTLQLHAEGGLGSVFRARDRLLSREVAVKFIQPHAAEDPQSRERFRLEAEITGNLEHPGVVPVYGMGTTDDNQPFYAMRFIQGETFDDAIQRYHASKKRRGDQESERLFRQLLVRFVAVCKTLAYAHNRGIIHRDIKPENVMLGRYGETIVIDWGLAMPVGRRGVFVDAGEKTLMPGSGSSSGGGFGGTPAFMSPEQAALSPNLTPATDIYSMGVVLYKILVGKVPFHGNHEEVRTKIIRGEYRHPHEANRSVSRALESICLKAMAPHAEERYKTALLLSEDVENYLADAPVTAYNEPFTRRLARWSRRHWMLSQALLMALLVVTLAGYSSAIIIDRMRSKAVTAQQLENEQRKQSLAVSARFAARTIADKVDIRLRILERAADDAQLVAALAAVNEDPEQREPLEFLQQRLDDLRVQNNAVEMRSLFLCAADGTQIARWPKFQDDAGQTPFDSLGKNYRYRDYFHGLGNDLQTGAPLAESHLSVAMESTNAGDLIIVFSTPVRVSPHGESIGILAMSMELTQLASLTIDLPPGQRALLVDTRKYFMKLKDSDQPGPRGVGLILYHDDLRDAKDYHGLRHIDDASLQHMIEGKPGADGIENLLPAEYRDPVGRESWLAAYAPVVLTARAVDSEVRQTRWFVIIQQHYEAVGLMGPEPHK